MKKIMGTIFGFIVSMNVYAFDVGDIVTAKEGPDAGLQGRVMATYVHDGQESFAVDFGDNRYGLYKEKDLEYRRSGIHPITDIEEKKKNEN